MCASWDGWEMLGLPGVVELLLLVSVPLEYGCLETVSPLPLPWLKAGSLLEEINEGPLPVDKLACEEDFRKWFIFGLFGDKLVWDELFVILGFPEASPLGERLIAWEKGKELRLVDIQGFEFDVFSSLAPDDGVFVDVGLLPFLGGPLPDGCLDLTIKSFLVWVLGFFESPVDTMLEPRDEEWLEVLTCLLIVEFGLPFTTFLGPSVSEYERCCALLTATASLDVPLWAPLEPELELKTSSSISPVLRRIFLSNRLT